MNTLNLNIMSNWSIINSNGRSISTQSIRKRIVSFLTKNHSNSVVESIERKYNAYKIYLMSGLCITFDADGQHINTK